MATNAVSTKPGDDAAGHSAAFNIFAVGGQPDKVTALFQLKAPINAQLPSQEPGQAIGALNVIAGNSNSLVTHFNQKFMKDTVDLVRVDLSGKLSSAIENHNLNEVQSLIAQKAEVTDDHLHQLITHPPLDATRKNFTDAVRCLLQAKAKPKNDDGVDRVNDTLFQGIGQELCSLSDVVDLLITEGAKVDDAILESAITLNRPTGTIRLLLNAGAKLEADALEFVIRRNADEDLVRLLLDAKRDWKLERDTYETALKYRAPRDGLAYSSNTMERLQGLLVQASKPEAVRSVQQSAQGIQPVQHAQEPLAQDPEAQSSHAERSDGPPSGGILACIGRIIGGLCAWLGEIVTDILNWFSRENGERS